MVSPLLSIVIPVYNRPQEVTAAIRSCLDQDAGDFEIVVVDDASTDNTTEAVRSLRDPRVRLIKQTENRGECPSRNRGVDESRGEWILWLDSDHALLPGALRVIEREIRAVPAGIDRVGFMYKFDDGRISPFPPPTGEVLDYPKYLLWMERSIVLDALMATRRQTFAKCRMPETRTLPTLYHLDFASRYKSLWLPSILAEQTTTSINRLSLGYGGQEQAKRKQRAEHDLAAIEAILARHGGALAIYAPGYLEGLSRARCLAICANSALRGIQAALAHLARYPASSRSWAVLICTLLGGKLAARMAAARRKYTERQGATLCIKHSSEEMCVR